MKKKMIMSLVVAGMMGLMLTGCGDKTPEKVTVEMEPTTEVTTEVTNPEEQPLVDEEPTVEATEEATDDTVEVEVVEDGTTVSDEQVEVGDYLTENGITITPQGTHVMKMADYGADTTHDREVEIKVETVPSSEEGYSDTILTARVDVTIGTNFNSGWHVYDRYTGLDLKGTAEDVEYYNEGGTNTTEGSLDVDGMLYDCSVTFNADTTSDPTAWLVTYTVHHPSEYDGVVFEVGKLSASQDALEDSLDDSVVRKIADYPELMEDQFYFTATDN
ncbi:MAG: hypothetical protein IJZ76_06720 [Lachnospiraceae bacterium]|nr:hypothetical protein [Lachnospiraceae bacterium]